MHISMIYVLEAIDFESSRATLAKVKRTLSHVVFTVSDSDINLVRNFTCMDIKVRGSN